MGASLSRPSGPTLYRSYGNEVHNYFRNYDNILRVDHHGRWGTPNSQMNWRARGPFWYHFFDIEVHPIGSSQSSVVGGDRTFTHNGYTVHVFSEPGDAELSVGSKNVEADILIVAGGGSGGTGNRGEGGGGGGAGGIILRRNYTLSSGSKVPITVGSGGASFRTSARDRGNPGQNSSFGDFTSVGGGYGSGMRHPGGDGGSGGGARGGWGNRRGGQGIDGQGHDGGDAGWYKGGSGGGGASQAGQSTLNSLPGGYGGDGRDFSSLFGSSVGSNGWFGGGGGGGARRPHESQGDGGRGGGGDGAGGTRGYGKDAVPHTGGGGGGTIGGSSSTDRVGAGAGGVVLVRYRS